MKKSEYLAPEMEIVEFREQCSILAGSGGGTTPDGSITDDDFPPGYGG